eukprot:1414680-Prymnesium_polylepis.1
MQDIAVRPSQAPTLMSAVALALSVVALLNSQPARGFHSALAEGTQHVTLSELAVYRENLVAGAVGSAELQDGAVGAAQLAPLSVDASKLAVGAVTPEKLDANVSRQLAKLAGSAGVLAGAVTEQGAVARGSGFTAQRVSTGEYVISFAPDVFDGPPIVLAVAQSYGICYVLSGSVTTES